MRMQFCPLAVALMIFTKVTHATVVTTTPSVSFDFGAESSQTVLLDSYTGTDLIVAVEANWIINLTGRVGKVTKVGGGTDSALVEYKQHVSLGAESFSTANNGDPLNNSIGTFYTDLTVIDTDPISGSNQFLFPDANITATTPVGWVDTPLFFYGSIGVPTKLPVDLSSLYILGLLSPGPFILDILDPGKISGEVSFSYITDPTISFIVDPLSPIPIPAAFWLFGPALIGLIGFSKRRKVA